MILHFRASGRKTSTYASLCGLCGGAAVPVFRFWDFGFAETNTARAGRALFVEKRLKTGEFEGAAVVVQGLLKDWA
jgi:hypothetical protein